MSNKKTWSPMQTAIFDYVERGMIANLVVVARAGCGKTTSLVEIANRLPKSSKAVFCAFNKSIATELASRLPSNFEAKTLHSIGFALVRRAYRNVRVDEMKGKTIVKTLCQKGGIFIDDRGYPDARTVGAIAKLAGLLKNMMVTEQSAAEDLCVQFDIVEEEDDITPASKLALEACEEAARQTGVVDFDDMIFFPWKLNLRAGWAEYVVVDETQDMNVAQLWLARRLLSSRGKMIIVGDPCQAIYAFRGADSGGIARMTRELEAVTLPLSVTYRCAKSIVTQAQQFVPDIEAAPNAPAGKVESTTKAHMMKNAKPGDFILSRKNAPMLKICLSLLAAGKPATIAGRDVGATLLTLVEKSKAKTVEDLVSWLAQYQDKEVAKFARLDPDVAEKKTQEVTDKVECILALLDGCSTIDCIKVKLDRLFSDNTPSSKIVLSSVHKAKGLERDTVWMLTDTFRPGKGEEEDNLMYVAITRARSELYYVSEPKED